MADKLLKYDVAMKSTKTVWQMETQRCYTGDENTVTFDFNITDLEAADLVGVIPNVYLYMRDGSFFQNGPADGVEITGKIVNYTMKGNEGKHSGIARAQLVLVWDDEINPPEKLTSQLYDFEVVSGLENKVAVEVMIQDWTTLTREARTFIDTSSDEVDALKGELQTAINTANASLGEFDVAMETGIVAANLAEKLEDFEEINNSRLLSTERQLAEAKADLQAGMGALTADAEVVTARSSTVTGVVHTVLDNRLEAIESDTVLNATNLVTNGDFSNGSTGWSNVDAVVNGVAEKTAVASWQTISQSAMIGVGVGDKYYLSANIKTPAQTIYLQLQEGVSPFFSHYIVAKPSTEMQRNSVVFTNEISGSARVLISDSAPSGWQKYYVDNVSLINLTATFGAGNEPTVAQMDRLLTQFPSSWFNGTENLFLAKWSLNELRRLDTEKLNKVQEAWITPTLQNGWTASDVNFYPVRYYKDEFGIVRLKGRIQGGTATTAITLPVGYRPDSSQLSFLCHISNTDSVCRVAITNTGGVIIATTLPANQGVYLDSISFKGV